MTCSAVHTGRGGRTTPDIADIFREHVGKLGPLSGQKARVIRAILSCRTAALGGHVRACNRCGHREIAYNSCRDRHCPKCQALEAARWVERQKRDLLPVPYFHVVFTIPKTLHPFFRTAPRHVVDLLFKSVAETLQEVALNPRHLGARIGFLTVLHTWTQKLLYHPHIHAILPAGGLNPAGGHWIASRRNFFLPVKVLSEVFRGKLLSRLEDSLTKGQIASCDASPRGLLQEAAKQDWVVYSKPPFAGPEIVLQYLARYTHRIAISNQRLLSAKDGRVTFLWRDRSDGNKAHVTTLEGVEFLRRFLLHVLPQGLVRIRYYGFMANSVRKELIPRCQELLTPRRLRDESRQTKDPPESWAELFSRLTGDDPLTCPVCRQGRLEIVEQLKSVGLIPWQLPGRGSSP